MRVLVNLAKTAMEDPFSPGEREMMCHDESVDWDPLTSDNSWTGCRRPESMSSTRTSTTTRSCLGWDARFVSIAAQINDAIDIDQLHIDHRKIIVVDGRVGGYCGCANMGV